MGDFKFNPFTEDLSPGYEDMFNNNRGGFMNYLLQRGGSPANAYQRQFSSGSADWLTGLMPMLVAAGGKNASDVRGENQFGGMLQEYLSPNQTKGAMSSNALDSLRSLKGKSTTGTQTQQNYLRGDNSDTIMALIQTILSKRMGGYMASQLFGGDAMDNMKAKFTQNQEGTNPSADLLTWLTQQGIL